jgi:hypothetical protein
MSIQTRSGLPEEVACAEVRLRLEGYRLAHAQSETELAPWEYFLLDASSEETSYKSRRKVSIIWRTVG